MAEGPDTLRLMLASDVEVHTVVSDAYPRPFTVLHSHCFFIDEAALISSLWPVAEALELPGTARRPHRRSGAADELPEHRDVKLIWWHVAVLRARCAP